MFTIEQIAAAHSKVKSGADFPKYIQDIKALGVKSYTTFVEDGHTVFKGEDGYEALSPAKYEIAPINAITNKTRFQKDLKEHQAGKSSYFKFSGLAAASGIEKWVTDLEAMTCTYFDTKGEIVLVETIPTL